MNIRTTFTDSLTYPFRDLKQFIILFILVLGAYYLILPIILVFGYLFRIIEHTLQGSSDLPDFEGLKEITVNGLKYLGVFIVLYTLPLFIINLILISASIPLILSSTLGSTIIFILAGFLINIVYFMALARLVKENRFSGAFAFKKIFEVIKTISWKKYLAYLAVYTIIFNLLTLIVNLVTSYMAYYVSYVSIQLMGLLMILILVLLNTYLYMFTSRFIGLIYPSKSEIDE